MQEHKDQPGDTDNPDRDKEALDSNGAAGPDEPRGVYHVTSATGDPPSGAAATSHNRRGYVPLADLGGGVRDARPPLGVQILSISCSFRENLACSRPHWRVHAPPSGKSWIRHCVQSTVAQFSPPRTPPWSPTPHRVQVCVCPAYNEFG